MSMNQILPNFPFPGRFRRAAALGGVAAIAILAPAPVLAAEQCGTPLLGTIFCPGTRYADGIQYETDGGSLHLTLSAEAQVDRGVSVVRQGDVTIDVRRGASIANEFGAGLRARSLEGDVAVSSYGVTAHASGGYGISVEGAHDVVVVDRGEIVTDGPAAHGIVAIAGGKATIDALSIRTLGEGANGMEVEAASADLRAASIRTEGYAAAAISAVARNGRLDIVSGEIVTTGGSSDGIFATTIAGDMVIRADDIRVEGDDSYGINAQANGDMSVEAGHVSTKGEGGYGIFLRGNGGTMTVSSANVETEGQGSAHGIYVSNVAPDDAEPAAAGKIVIHSGKVTTQSGNGILAFGLGSGIDIESETVISGGNGIAAIAFAPSGGSDDDAVDYVPAESIAIRSGFIDSSEAGIIAISERGDVAIDSGQISARGVGINAQSLAGGVAIASGSVQARGEGNVALLAVAGGDIEIASGLAVTDGVAAAGISAASLNGDVAIVAQTTRTGGDDASGIVASTVTGKIAIKAATVMTTGAGAVGISADSVGGAIAIDVDKIETNGTAAHGIEVTGGDAVMIKARAIQASGAGSDAVRISSSAKSNVTLSGLVKSASGAAARVSALDRIDLLVGADASVVGAEAGLRLSAGAAVDVDVRGYLSSGEGYAIDASASDIRISVAQGGQVRGAVKLAGGQSRIENRGIFTLTGDSSFTGGQDVFDNRGVVRLGVGAPPAAFGTTAAAPATVRLVGLERFDNSGMLDLRNGVAGDQFVIGGTYHGNTGAVLAVDVLFGTGGATADQLIVDKATGTTLLRLNPLGATRFGDSGVIVIRSASQQTGNEFAVDSSDGMIGLGLAYNPVTNSWTAVVEPGSRANEAAKFGAGALGVWRQSADAWSAAALAERRAIPGSGVMSWLQGYGVREDVGNRANAGGGSADPELGYRQTGWGTQGGVETPVGQVIVGATFGYADHDQDFGQSGTAAHYDGGNAGLYARWRKGDFFANLLAKADWFTLKANWSSADTATRAKGRALGARAEAGWRGDFGKWFVEPSVGLSWADAQLGSLEGDSIAIRFDRADSLRANAALRAGLRAEAGSITFEPFVAVAGAKEFRGRNVTRLGLGSDSTRLVDRPADGNGSAILGITLRGRSGWSLFAEGQALFGDTDGLSGRAGLRWRW